jgi:lipopolysaccharide transport system permease protein
VAAGTAGVHFLFKYGAFLFFYLLYLFRDGTRSCPDVPGLLLIPVLWLFILVLAGGVGLLCASLSVRYRDFHFALPVLLQTWMFASPIIYPSSLVPETWRPYYYLNPMATMLEAHRSVFLGTEFPPPLFLMLGGILSFVLLVLGLYTFSRTEQTLTDVL